jgi:hypothetical protein
MKRAAGGVSIAEARSQAGLRKRAQALLDKIEGANIDIAWHKRAPVPETPVMG